MYVKKTGIALYSLLLTAAVLFSGVSAAYASDDPYSYEAYETSIASEAIPDPLEGVNRGVFAFNRVVDVYFMAPIARSYRKIVHAKIRGMVSNAALNLRRPGSALNHLLQGDFRNAVDTTAAFFIDSTMGGAGMLGIPQAAGIRPDEESFAQTFGKWGIGPGVYLVLPFAGPSSVRGAAGFLLDRAAMPQYYLLHGEDVALAAEGAVSAVNARYELLPVTEEIESGAVFDLYSAYRSAYIQNMNTRIRQ